MFLGLSVETMVTGLSSLSHSDANELPSGRWVFASMRKFAGKRGVVGRSEGSEPCLLLSPTMHATKPARGSHISCHVRVGGLRKSRTTRLKVRSFSLPQISYSFEKNDHFDFTQSNHPSRRVPES
ncbi:hypothetical protein L1049_008656 [Liquidambar formosana]|uniref:Uncharacterized protein n=1 Tax=Liquidambar formosana TaxID=63359 RepID=A0AAP0X4Q9_LIQFO